MQHKAHNAIKLPRPTESVQQGIVWLAVKVVGIFMQLYVSSLLHLVLKELSLILELLRHLTAE